MRKNDPEYVKYIRQSNAICNYASQAVCCPNDGATPSPPVTSAPVITEPTTQSPIGVRSSRLISREEGCGVSKVPHNRVVGGVPAKKGMNQVQVQ
jgi:hypothetical protein